MDHPDQCAGSGCGIAPSPQIFRPSAIPELHIFAVVCNVVCIQCQKMLLNGKCRFIFQIVISILCSPVILIEYLLVSCKSKGLLQTAFSILCAPICLLQYLLGVVLKSSKSHQKRLPIEKQKTLLMTGASIQGMYILFAETPIY